MSRVLKRSFSTSFRTCAGTTGPAPSLAICFRENGDPSKVLQAVKYELPELKKGQVRVRFDASAVNPADINVIQGVYPAKPERRAGVLPDGDVTIMGNEGTAIVEGFIDDGRVEQELQVGDRVTMGRSQQSTWQSRANLPYKNLIPLSTSKPLTPVQAATLSINPPTALRMMSDFVDLHPETRSPGQHWLIQNGANSAVGTAVIQLAREWGVNTINLVRSRDDIDELKRQLTDLGATRVMTYDEFMQRDKRRAIKELVGQDGGSLRLALNCIGGKETTEMVKVLDPEGVLVTYGGMSKTALSVPPSLFIFKKLTCTGFWLSDWVDSHPEERLKMMRTLAQMVSDGRLKEPEVEEVSISAGEDVDVTTQLVRDTLKRIEDGRSRKVIWRWQDA